MDVFTYHIVNIKLIYLDLIFLQLYLFTYHIVNIKPQNKLCISKTYTHITFSICSERVIVQLITLIKPSQCLVFQLLSHILLQKSNTAKSLHFYYIIKILFLNICTNLWYNKSKEIIIYFIQE